MMAEINDDDETSIMAEYFGMNTQNVVEDMSAQAYTETIR